jgi:hypothetical protein
MNQEIERAIIDQTNKVWEQALKVGMADERQRIMKLLENKMFENKKLLSKDFSNGAVWAVKELVELIKGEK